MMNRHEIIFLFKTMFKYGFQLLIVLVLFVMVSKYSANVWNLFTIINNFLIPIKHFIQDNMPILSHFCLFSLIALFCVSVKTPKHHFESFKLLTKLLVLTLIFSTFLIFCTADMHDGLVSFTLYIFAFLVCPLIFIIKRDLLELIAEAELKI